MNYKIWVGDLPRETIIQILENMGARGIRTVAGQPAKCLNFFTDGGPLHLCGLFLSGSTVLRLSDDPDAGRVRFDNYLTYTEINPFEYIGIKYDENEFLSMIRGE